MVEYLVKGLVIGFAIAAPVGPIGVLCIRRTLAEGRASGLATGLGAATADAFYGAVAGFGLTAISGFLLSYQVWLQLLGGLFLCGLGLKTCLHKPGAEVVRVGGRGLVQAYVTSVALTLTNPATILSFAAVFAGAGLGQAQADVADASALVAGVFLGSTIWWFNLSGFVARWRRRYPSAEQLVRKPLGGVVLTGISLGIGAKQFRNVNRVSGLLLTGFGLWSLFLASRV